MQNSCNSTVGEMRERNCCRVHPDVPTFEENGLTYDVRRARANIDPYRIAAVGYGKPPFAIGCSNPASRTFLSKQNLFGFAHTNSGDGDFAIFNQCDVVTVQW